MAKNELFSKNLYDGLAEEIMKTNVAEVVNSEII